jgi:hypothetical protein
VEDIFGLGFQNLNLCRLENKRKNFFQVVVLTCVVISFSVWLKEIWDLEVPFSTASMLILPPQNSRICYLQVEIITRIKSENETELYSEVKQNIILVNIVNK